MTVETEEEFREAFGRMLDDESIDLDPPSELVDNYRISDSAEEHGLLDETDWEGIRGVCKATVILL